MLQTAGLIINTMFWHFKMTEYNFMMFTILWILISEEITSIYATDLLYRDFQTFGLPIPNAIDSNPQDFDQNSNFINYPTSSSWFANVPGDGASNAEVYRYEQSTQFLPGYRNDYQLQRLTELQPPPSKFFEADYPTPEIDYAFEQEIQRARIIAPSLLGDQNVVPPIFAGKVSSKSPDDTPNWSYDAGYNGPENWKNLYPNCGKMRQSPIDIASMKMFPASEKINVEWSGHDEIPNDMTLYNNGHSVEVSGSWDNQPYISNGALAGTYILAQVHFHWGMKNTEGSEHTINGIAFPMEMHMVHYKKQYGSVTNAVTHTDGLAVVAYMFEMGEPGNSALDKIAAELTKIRKPGQKALLRQPFALRELAMPFSGDYASYSGSLTTPGCHESVTWIISSTSIAVSDAQIQQFRKIKSNHGSTSANFRPIQHLNGRQIFYVNNNNK